MAVLKEKGVWQSNLSYTTEKKVLPVTRKREIRYINGQPVNLFEDEWDEIDRQELYLKNGFEFGYEKGD